MSWKFGMRSGASSNRSSSARINFQSASRVRTQENSGETRKGVSGTSEYLIRIRSMRLMSHSPSATLGRRFFLSSVTAISPVSPA